MDHSAVLGDSVKVAAKTRRSITCSGERDKDISCLFRA